MSNFMTKRINSIQPRTRQDYADRSTSVSCASAMHKSWNSLNLKSTPFFGGEESSTKFTFLFFMMQVLCSKTGIKTNHAGTMPTATGTSSSPPSASHPTTCFTVATAQCSYSSSMGQLVLLSRAKKKSLCLTAVVSICFAVCWLPWSATMLLRTFEVPLPGTDRRTYTHTHRSHRHIWYGCPHHFSSTWVKTLNCDTFPRRSWWLRFEKISSSSHFFHI